MVDYRNEKLAPPDRKLSQINPWMLLFLECVLSCVVGYKYTDVAKGGADSIVSESSPQSHSLFVLDPFSSKVCRPIYFCVFQVVSFLRIF